jgi:hypothetical protein
MGNRKEPLIKEIMRKDERLPYFTIDYLKLIGVALSNQD